MRSRWAAVAVLLLLSGGRAAAQELHGRVRETYRSTSGDRETVENVLQNYEINFKNTVAQGLFWQARLRALVSGFDRTAAPSSGTTLLEPFVQAVYEGPDWQISGGARLTRSTPDGDDAGTVDRTRRDLFGRIAWGRENRPRLDWSLYRIGLEEDGAETTAEDRSLLTLARGGEMGTLSLGLENRRFLDRRTDFTRDSVQATLNADLRRTFGGDRLVVGGQALVVHGRTDEETPQAVEIDAQRRPRSGLYGVDTLPASGALADTPALVDGDLTDPAADLSGEFRNFGADLGFADAVDTVFLFIERRLLPGSEIGYAWDVYSSDDGDFWTQRAIGAGSRFDDLENRFEIRFPAVTARFLKIVNTRFSLDEPPLAATEIQVFGRETRSGRESRTESRRSANLGVTWHAGAGIDVSLNTFASRQGIADGGAGASRDLNSTLTTIVRSGGLVTTARLQAINRGTDLGRPEHDRIASVGLSISPLPTLDLSLSGTHRRNTAPGQVLVGSNAANLRAAARFLHDIEAALDLGILRQEEESIGRVTSRRTASLSLVTTLRPGLFLTNAWTAERIEFDDEAFPDRTELDLRTRLSYRPTRVLGAAVEFLYQDIAGVSGAARLYDLDWLPFPGGALQMQFVLTRDHRSVTGSLRDETRVAARWTLNPRTILDLAHSVLQVGDAAAERQRLTTAFLEYRF